MKKLLLALALALYALPTGAADNFAINDAQGNFQVICAVDTAGVKTLCTTPSSASAITSRGTATAAAPSYIEGSPNALSMDLAGNLRTVPLGNVASGAADSGAPLKIGGIFETTPTVVTNGQRSNVHTSASGILLSAIADTTGTTPISIQLITSDGIAAGTAFNVVAKTVWFNGATWDRAFTCPTTAVINVTAGSTTELVALSASQVIRVCSFAITMSVAGTAKFLYGTGTNCGTGPADLTGAMTLGTTTPMTISASAGSVFRTASANALCLAAVTGNVTGFVTYAKY